MAKGFSIFSTVILRTRKVDLRTTKVDLATPLTVIGKALASSQRNASKRQRSSGGKHQEDVHCTIMCGYGSKRRHYEDECHIRRCESQKHEKS